MFGFLRRKKPPASSAQTAPEVTAESPDAAASPEVPVASDAGPAAVAPVASTMPETTSAPAMQAARMPHPVPEPTPAMQTLAAHGAASAATPSSAPAATDAESAAPPARASWRERLRGGLTRTRVGLTGLFRGVKVDEHLFEELETALLMADTGVDATQRLLTLLRARVKERRVEDADGVRATLRELVAEQLAPLEQPMDIDVATPLVMMIAGVNGAGKTTSIGKLAHHLRAEGKSILLAAGDTFRAAAREQLTTWGERNDVQVIAQQGGDPAAVAFDAVSAGIARRTGVVMIDTAGRLPTQKHLMEELKKIRRVVGKAMADAPHQALLILDGNTGQNMLAQVSAFDEAIGLTGLIVTKLDGTARGGALLGLAHQRRDRPIPVYFIGVGEGIDDLQAFSSVEFADALVGAGQG